MTWCGADPEEDALLISNLSAPPNYWFLCTTVLNWLSLSPLTFIEGFMYCRDSGPLCFIQLITRKENAETHLGINKKKEDSCSTYATSWSNDNMQNAHWPRGTVSICIVSVNSEEWRGVVWVRMTSSCRNTDPNTMGKRLCPSILSPFKKPSQESHPTSCV